MKFCNFILDFFLNKRIKPLFLLMICLVLQNVYGQFTTRVVYFGSDKKLTYASEMGLFKTYEDFLNNKEIKVESVKIKRDWRDEFNYEMIINGEKVKAKSSELAKQYWGFHNFEQVFLFDGSINYSENPNQNWELFCVGKLCLFAGTNFEFTDFTIDENQHYHYNYKCNFGIPMHAGISLGFGETIYPLTNDNFMMLLAKIDEGYKVNYEEDYLALEIKQSSFKQYVDATPDNLKLFIRYFELVNNEDVK